MSRAKRIYSDQYPYHISARCINKEWFEIPISDVWEVFNDHLYFCHHAFEAEILSFVLMSNHFHLIVKTPLGNISEIMQHLMGETSKELSRKSHRINQTYGGPYYSSLITKDIHYMHAYKYVYRNPIEAGLSSCAEEYRYSSLAALLGFSRSIIPISSDEILFPDVEKTLDWLNTPYQGDIRENLRQALRKKNFAIPRDRVSRQPSILESILS